MYKLKSIRTKAISENEIDYNDDNFFNISDNTGFVNIPNEEFFTVPNILIWENICEKRLPIFLNYISFLFKDKIIGIISKNKDKVILKTILNIFNNNSEFFRFFIFCTSSQLLVNKNTALLKNDIMKLPFVFEKKSEEFFSEIDKNIISDVNTYMQDFLRHGEKSTAVKPIKKDFDDVLKNYGQEFSRALNVMYEKNGKKFMMTVQ